MSADEPAVMPKNPWDSHPEETDMAYGAFVVYRDMGPRRSIAKTAEEFYKLTGKTSAKLRGSKIRICEAWSSRFSWVDRAKSWDVYVDQSSQEQQLAEIVAMRKRHAHLSQGLLERMGARLFGGEVNGVKVEPINAEGLSTYELLRALEVGVKVERLSRGEPEQIVDNRVSGSIDKPSASGPSPQEIARQILSDPKLTDLAAQLTKGLPAVHQPEVKGTPAA